MEQRTATTAAAAHDLLSTTPPEMRTEPWSVSLGARARHGGGKAASMSSMPPGYPTAFGTVTHCACLLGTVPLHRSISDGNGGGHLLHLSSPYSSSMTMIV